MMDSVAADRERWSDRELLAAIAKRDPAAFTAFYRRHLPAAVAYLMRQTRDPELTADLAAEVFAAVILAARGYRPEGDSAVPWLLAIARNTLGTSRRRGRVEDRARQRLGFEPLELEDSDLEHTEAMADDRRGSVVELLGSLPSAERDAVSARVLDERSYAEIARELRCSEMVIRKRVSRGLAHLRQRLEGSS
jgi:RNA polymerase sigma factor (sigma-70 family)